MVSAVAVVLIMLGIIAGRMASKDVQGPDGTAAKKVSLTNVAIYREGYSSIPANGLVESEAQADLKSQTGAPIASIRVSIGDIVYPGQTLIELESADIRAQLAQAEASLEMAKGQFQTGSVSVESAKKSAVDKVKDSYVKSQDIIFAQIDPILNNYDGKGSQLYSFISDSRVSSQVRDIRIDLAVAFPIWQSSTAVLTESSADTAIRSAISLSQKNLGTIDRLLNSISEAVNETAKTANPELAILLDKWKSIISVSRTTVSGSVQSLTAADSALTSASSAQNLTAPASVRAAEAGVNNLRAQLAKTVIRSPISGKIAALPLRQGELASPGTLLATVVGDGGMVIKAFASGEDSSRIRVGSPVVIRGNAKGVVESFSPSVSSSNKKVEVVIRVLEPDESGLIIGDSVQALISTDATEAVPASSATTSNSAKYILPIQSVKIIPGSAFVFTLDHESKIKRNDIILGEVRGDFVEVIGGLNDSMEIVVPVYELEEGQTVTVE